MTDGGEWDREERQRELAVDSLPKWRWFAPWSKRLAARPLPQLPESPEGGEEDR